MLYLKEDGIFGSKKVGKAAVCTLGRVENKKSLISFKSQAGLYGAHKNKVIRHVLKFQNICFHIGNAPRRGLFENFEICL